MGEFDDAWKASVRKVLDKKKKKQKYIVCRNCKGNGYIVAERLSKKHLRTETCKDCGGSGHLGSIDVEEKNMEQRSQI